MDVLSYLTALIQTRKTVGISGLGTVFKKKLPGRYDAELHAFVPPSYTLDFTPEVKEELILADYIGEKRNVKNDTALYFINEFSTGILSKLAIDKQASLGTLGKLVKENGNIKFEPDQSINYGFDFYGLPSVKEDQESQAEQEIPSQEEIPVSASSNPFDQYKRTEQQLQEEIESLNFYRSKSPASKPAAPADEDVILQLNHSAAEDKNGTEAQQSIAYPTFIPEEIEVKTTPVYLKVLYSLIALVLIAGLVYVVKPALFDPYIGASKTPDTSLKVVTAIPATTTVDSTGVQDSIQKSGAALPATQQDTLIKILPVVPADTATLYEIIGASMHNQKEANDFIALMKRSGIDAKVVTNMSGKRLKMSIATLKDEKSAKEELDRLSKKLKIPGIYIYRNKQK